MSSFGSPPLSPGSSSGGQAPRRRGRVTLRESGQSGSSMQDMLDPASRSLTDALKITFRLLQVAMVFILGAFLLSGFQRVNESERGLRLTFGRIAAKDLQPGFQASLPEPLGELIRVGTGEQTIELRQEFFPRLSEQDELAIKDKGLQQLGANANNALDPDADGALLTADGNIVHARVTVTYRRVDAARTVQSIADDSPQRSTGESVETRMVRAAVRQGMVHGAAVVSVDEFLNSTPDRGRVGAFVPVESIAKQVAQQALDALESGIEIQSLSLTSESAPRFLVNDFSQVTSAQATAQRQVADAELARRERLNEVAGGAAEIILAQIARYERELEGGEPDKAEVTLGAIHKLLLKQPVEIDGKPVTAETFGRASNLLTDAQQYRTNVVSRSQADAGLFAAKRQEFTSNPLVMVHNEWTQALGDFMQRPSVQAMMLPLSTGRVALQINRDPAIAREQEAQQAEAEAKAANDARIRARREGIYRDRMDGTGAENN
jgi:regulator of protease activity HflC (stomatin/prohibitin superfamily)